MDFKKTINIQGTLVDLSIPKVMGIINVTPDSFYAGSRKQREEDVLRTAEKMLKEGATFLDVGGYSSRPGAENIPVEEEKRRVLEPVKWIAVNFPEAIISIDTFRSEVATEAVACGASLVNDISGGDLDEGMIREVARLKVPYISMHMRGTPQTMKQKTDYNDLISEIADSFSTKLKKAEEAGIKDVIIDPGFGFAKTVKQNFFLLSHVNYLRSIGRPILVGVSRKSMVCKTLKIASEEALNGTTVLNTVALLQGASILRVHDVKEAVEAVKLVNQLSI